MKPKYSIERGDTKGLRSVGLRELGYSDIRVEVPSAELEDAAQAMLRTLAEYQIKSKIRIRGNQTVAHGSWMLFMKDAEHALDVWELSPGGGEPMPGAGLTLQLWSEQKKVCDGLRSSFEPPRYGDFLSVSAGVFEGDFPLEGVRYPMERQISGWILTTDRYTDVASMRNEHVHHLVSSRRAIVKYLALPAGFHYRLTETDVSIGFDKAVARGD